MQATCFFFTFDYEDDVYWEIAFGLQTLLHAHYMSEDLTFVIGRAPSNKAAITNHRFKRRSLPKFQGIRRLNIIMPVNENCFPAWLVIISSQNDRIAAGGKFLGIEARLFEAP